MAPKKIVAKPETVAKGKLAKQKKETKEKPRLKTPTVVKIKLPVKNISRTILNNTSSNVLNKKNKDLTVTDKLDLSNTVALAQLDKSAPVIFPPEPPAVKKRGRKKKADQVVNNEEGTAAENHELPTPSLVANSTDSEAPNRKYVRKRQASTSKVVPLMKIAVNDAPKPAPKVERRPLKRKLVSSTNENTQQYQPQPKRRWTQSRITDLKILVRRNSMASSNGDKKRTITVAKPQVVRKRAPRGKRNVKNQSGSVAESPSILARPPDQVCELLNCDIKKEKDVKSLTNAGPVDSRKTSVTSELSWTKDISDSSNTTSVTAVSASDFVLIDKKLPEVKLTKINTIPEEYTEPVREFTPRTPSSSSSSSSDTDSSDSESVRNYGKESDIVSRHSLNLSTSSESHRSPIIKQKNISINTMNNVSKISKALDKLSESLKKIDLEMINWVGYQNEDININGKKLRHKIHLSLQEESNIILQCRHVNKVLTDNEDATNEDDNVTQTVKDNNELFVKPTDTAVHKTANKTNHCNDKGSHSEDQVDYTENKFDMNENFASDSLPYVPFQQSFDDEDALSLYAESIGFESHRNSISSPPHVNPEYEEYIPQPIARNVIPSNKIVYNPSKITNDTAKLPVTVQSVRPVCEKQNADSTSVVKDQSQNTILVEGIDNLPVPVVNPPAIDAQVKKGPRLLAMQFKPLPGVKSVVFKGMCFFHLIASCKNQTKCRFPHVEPTEIEIFAKLNKLSEASFIQEYMLLRNWPSLRRKYGICFLHECKRRDLTRLFVEMAIDYVMKANPNHPDDAAIKINVLEEALMHLNNINLNTCEDLLKYVVQDRQLCDVFMETIANTQNFTRFKPVFIKLTEFVIENSKVFSIDVATHILERVAILPFNDSLAWALISIIKHTDAVIFENSMMSQFEKQLSSNEGLHREFLKVKEEAGLSQPPSSQDYSPVLPPVVRQEVDRVLTSPMYPDGVQRYTSPDTTHLDTMNKTQAEPIITRTINFDRKIPNYSSSSSESTEEYPGTPKPKLSYESWMNKSIFNNISPQRFQKRRINRQVTYGGVGPNFPRHPGPSFF